jgi:prepilin-type N-terminal cleavage/methylation domain-containing protein
MIDQLQFILKSHLKKKRSHIAKKNSGFTLIELLVAMILAVLVITPLLGFMINILDTDRKEQAKVNSEQEIQTALDYIAQDLKQAIYIYDARGIDAIQDELPYASDANKIPVLVFWKREFKKGAVTRNYYSGTNDGFVYSLVTYYLIKSNSTNNPNNIWSNQFRIAKFELKGGIKDPDEPFETDSNGQFNLDSDGNPIPKYITDPDPGFALFAVDDPAITGTVEEKMNRWEKGDEDYELRNTAVLVDYIDASPKNASAYPELEPIDCTNVFDVDRVPDELQASRIAAQRVPSFSGTHSYSTNGDLNNGSFYACVDVDRISAKVFIRGNAYARINNRDTNYNKNRQSYFPTASSQVKARGILGIFKE